MTLPRSLCLGLAIMMHGQMVESSLGWEHTFTPHTDPDANVPQGFEYTLDWNISSTTLDIRIEAPTTGWLAFGIGEDGAGAMPGADIVACTAEGWVSDRYALHYSTPLEDVQQDWLLVESGTTLSGSFCVLRRALVTEDRQDRDLPMQRLELGPVGILMAYGDSDTFMYHGRTQRSTAQINILNPTTFSDKLRGLSDNDMNITFRNTPFNVPYDVATCNYLNNLEEDSECLGPTTTYYRERFNLTEFSGRSIIAVAPVINQTNVAHVHHFVVNAYLDSGCSESSTGPIYIWAPGTQPLFLSDNLGFTIGPESLLCILIETHYDNPTHNPSIVDNSGVTFFMTSTEFPRPVEVGMMQIGDPSVRLQDVTLIDGLSRYNFTCPDDNFVEIPDVTIFLLVHHMHVAGTMMGTTLARQAVGNVTWTTEHYDFNFQTFIPTNVTMSASEVKEMSNYCVFDSQTSMEYPYSTPSGKWGLGSNDEMCISFFYYYPRVQGAAGVCVLNLDKDRQLPNASSDLAPPNLPEGTTSVRLESLSNPIEFTLPYPIFCFRDDENNIQHLIYCSWDGSAYTSHWVSWYAGLESNECRTVYIGNPSFVNVSSPSGNTINGDWRITCEFAGTYGGYLVESKQLANEAELHRVFGVFQPPLTSTTVGPIESGSNSDDESSTAIIIGASVGGLVLIVIMVFVAMKVMSSSKPSNAAQNRAEMF